MVVRPGFRALGEGVVGMRLPSWLRALLREQYSDFATVLDHDSVAASGDPLEEVTGIRSGLVEPPENPVLRRLRPDGYARDVEDGKAAVEFRRFTERDLAALQRARVATVLQTVTEGDKVELTAAQAQDWLGALNDLRLALGTAIGVTEEPETQTFEGEAAAAYEVYSLLGHLQYLLLEALGAPLEA